MSNANPNSDVQQFNGRVEIDDLHVNAGITLAAGSVSAPAGSIPLSAVSGAAADAAVVHLAGSESITGTKTFSTNPVFNTAGIPLSAVSGTGSFAITGESGASDFKPSGLTGATAASRYVGATTAGAPTTGTFAKGDYVISQASGSVFVCTVAGTPGTWQVAGDRYDIRDYGAATATADNTSFIQAAITAWLNGGSRGKVYVPAGIFKYASAITNATDGLIMEGTGKTSSILRFTGTGAGIAFDSHGTNFTELRSLAFDYTSGSFTGRLVDIGRGSQPKALDCSFGSQFGTNIRSAFCGLSVSNSVTPQVDHCVFDGNKYDILLGEDVNGWSQAFVISACDFNNSNMTSDAHIRNPVNGRITGCNFENLANGTVKCVSMASTILKPRGITVDGCWIGDNWNVNAPTAVAAAGSTGLAAGQYTLAYSYVINGIETSLSPPVQVTLTPGQQINVGTVSYGSLALGDQTGLVPTAVKWYFTAVPGGMTAGFIVSNANGNTFSITTQGNGTTNTVGTWGAFEIWGDGLIFKGNDANGSSSSVNNSAFVRVVNGTASGLEVTSNDLTQFQQPLDISAGADFVIYENNTENSCGTPVVTGTPTTTGRVERSGGGVTLYGALNGLVVAAPQGATPAVSVTGNLAANIPNTTDGLAIGANYSNGSIEVDFFNANQGANQSFFFYQKTGAATVRQLMSMAASGDITIPNGFLRLNTGLDYHYAATAAGTGAAPTLPANTPTGAAGGVGKWVAVQLNGATAYLLVWQ